MKSDKGIKENFIKKKYREVLYKNQRKLEEEGNTSCNSPESVSFFFFWSMIRQGSTLAVEPCCYPCYRTRKLTTRGHEKSANSKG